jgi:hypothetical protein
MKRREFITQRSDRVKFQRHFVAVAPHRLDRSAGLRFLVGGKRDT